MDAENRQPADARPDDPLDGLLAAAKWPEPSAESQQRLRRYWAEISPAREQQPGRFLRFQRPARWAIAAAVLAAVAGAAWITWVRTRVPATPIVNPLPTPAPTDMPRGPTPGAVVHGGPSAAPALVRPATPAETFLVRAAAAQDRAAYARRTAQARIQRAVESAATDPAFNAAADAADLQSSIPADVLAASLSDLARSRDSSRRRGAAVLLAELRLPRTLPALVRLADEAETRSAVLPAVIELASPGALADLARRVPDGSDRVRLLGALATRDEGQPGPATGLFLQALGDPAMSSAALRALDGLEHPPVEPLFAQLRHPDVRMRLASAKALARIDGPAVTARLEVMVRQDVNRREAVAALLYCDSPEAAEFLRAARRSPDLAATINAVAAQARS
jgi:hypothetical protein